MSFTEQTQPHFGRWKFQGQPASEVQGIAIRYIRYGFNGIMDIINWYIWYIHRYTSLTIVTWGEIEEVWEPKFQGLIIRFPVTFFWQHILKHQYRTERLYPFFVHIYLQLEW